MATGPLKASRLIWLISFVVGLLAAYFVFLFRSDQLKRLNEVLTGLDTNHDAQTLRALATLLVWASMGALALVIAIEAILLAVMMRGHGWARWVLLGVLVVHAAVWVVVDAVIVAPDAQVIYFRILLLFAARAGQRGAGPRLLPRRHCLVQGRARVAPSQARLSPPAIEPRSPRSFGRRSGTLRRRPDS